MNLSVNEECLVAEPGITPGMLRRRHFPSADLTILNGCPVGDDHPLADGDRLVFITRGAVPSREELEGLMVARHTPAVFGRMKKASVGIAGVGGLGSAVALALTRMGVGRLVLADGDVVEPSNLNRQHYFTDQIGERKVEALAETLTRVNPFCRVETHSVWLDRENIPAVFAGMDVVVEAFDIPSAKVMLIDRVMEALPGTPVVAASGVAGYGSGNTVVIRKMTDLLWVVGDLETGAQPGTGLMAPRVGIAAHHQANAVVRLLLGEDPVG